MTTGCVYPSPSSSQVDAYRAVRVTETALHATQTFDLSYQDDGHAFNLTIERQLSAYHATYDRTARLTRDRPSRRPRAPKRWHKQFQAEIKDVKKGLKALKTGFKELRKDLHHGRADKVREDLQDLRNILTDTQLEAHGFKKMLHRFLKVNDGKYADRFRDPDPLEAEFRAFEKEHAEVLSVHETLKTSMDVVDPEYWSTENTAQRLADFAIGLYAGGDRDEHYEKMVDTMEQGYREAADAFGGVLPEISRVTMDRAEELLAVWANAGEAPAEPEEDPETVSLVA